MRDFGAILLNCGQGVFQFDAATMLTRVVTCVAAAGLPLRLSQLGSGWHRMTTGLPQSHPTSGTPPPGSLPK